jgi:hypothetical protein
MRDTYGNNLVGGGALVEVALLGVSGNSYFYILNNYLNQTYCNISFYFECIGLWGIEYPRDNAQWTGLPNTFYYKGS